MTKLAKSMLSGIIALCLISGAAFADHHSESNTSTKSKNTMVTLKTNFGDIEIELNAEKAPKTVENFLQYVKEGHYNGVIFHRVINNFMIQGGGFDADMKEKKSRGPIPNEASNGLTNDKYTLAMARTSEPHSASAQFFINTKDNDFLNFSSETQNGWGYAVFAKVVGGIDVVDKIEAVRTGQVGPYGDVPMEPVIIESVSIAE
jgi:peptidyl-prolyl cis-trans isomerase B (cyclophilin B)